MLAPLMTAPSALFGWESSDPTTVTPVLLVPDVNAIQLLPFQIYDAELPGASVMLPMSKLAEPTLFR